MSGRSLAAWGAGASVVLTSTTSMAGPGPEPDTVLATPEAIIED
jgi:hypothetical protein